MKSKHSVLQKAPPLSSLHGPGRRGLWAQSCATGPRAGPKSPRWEQRGRGGPDGQPSPTLGRRGPRAKRRWRRTQPQSRELTPGGRSCYSRFLPIATSPNSRIWGHQAPKLTIFRLGRSLWRPPDSSCGQWSSQPTKTEKGFGARRLQKTPDSPSAEPPLLPERACLDSKPRPAPESLIG